MMVMTRSNSTKSKTGAGWSTPRSPIARARSVPLHRRCWHPNGVLNVPTPPLSANSQYQARRRNRALSPERGDAFAGETPARSYKDIMMAQNLEREEQEVLRKIEKKREAEGDAAAAPPASEPAAKPAKKRRRWDDTGDASATAGKSADWDGDATPGRFDATPGRFDATPALTRRRRFDATPGRFDATPGRFDATPGRLTRRQVDSTRRRAALIKRPGASTRRQDGSTRRRDA